MYTALKKRRVPARFVRTGYVSRGWTPGTRCTAPPELLWWDRYLGSTLP